jgi:hypothetical protein
MAQPSTLRSRQFTRLYATISQDEDTFMVAVKLLHHLRPAEGVWGEEIASSLEMASAMIEGLAQEFAIPQKCIAIKIQMLSFKQGTMH